MARGGSEETVGTMAALTAGFDWSRTPLGPRGAWRQSLVTATDMMLASGHAMCIAWGPARTFLYNDAYVPILGRRHPAALGIGFADAWPDVWDEIAPLVDRTFAGETSTFRDLPLVMTRNGYPEDTSWTFSYSPIRDEAGAVAGLLNVTLETTELVAARERERLLAEELSHRLKNTLSLVQAIAVQTIGADAATEPAMASFAARLQTLSSAHDVLLGQHWSTARLYDVAEGVLATFGTRERIALDGPDVTLGSPAALSLSLLLHELATNATKYGALSVPAGRVDLRWTRHGDGEAALLTLAWHERGGPAATAPRHRGFGSRIIRLGLVGAGDADLRYGEEGLTATFTAPLAAVQRA